MNISLLRKVFAKVPAVKLAYLFGSRARGDNGTMSDFDFRYTMRKYHLTKA